MPFADWTAFCLASEDVTAPLAAEDTCSDDGSMEHGVVFFMPRRMGLACSKLKLYTVNSKQIDTALLLVNTSYVTSFSL